MVSTNDQYIIAIKTYNNCVFRCAFGINTVVNTIMLKSKSSHSGFKSLVTMFMSLL